MLEKIREGSQGVWAIVILGLVILSFVFAGVGGYVSSSSDVAAASVNGEDISQTALERAYQNERARMESQLGDAFSEAMLDAEYLSQFRQGVLDRLIGDKLIEQTADELGLRVSDAQVRDAIVNMPEFQVGGRFDNDRFQILLRQNGYQVNTFRDYLRSEMTRQQVVAALLNSEFALPSEVSQIHALQQQTRDLRYLTVATAPFKNEVTVSDDDINAYYQQNLAQFDTQEQIKLAYVTLRAADLEGDISVTSEEAREYYEANRNAYVTEEMRRVSHILVEAGEDEQQARARAEELLSRVQNGEDFATVAAEASDDSFSAENGGDLEWVGRDDFEASFTDAVYALDNVGDVTDVVETESGFHVIKLTDIQAESSTPFEEVESTIVAQLKNEKAMDEFFAIQQRMAEVAFEVPDSLEDVAIEVDGKVEQTEVFARANPPAAVAAPQVLAAAFSDELIYDGVNSDVIEIASDEVMVIRVVEHQPERTRAIDEVKTQITTALTEEKAQLAAKTWAESLQSELVAGNDISESLAAKDLEWQTAEKVARFGAELDGALVQQAFSLAPSGENRAVVELYSGDVALVEVTGIHAAESADDQLLANLGRRMESARSQAGFSDLIEALRARADISIYN